MWSATKENFIKNPVRNSPHSGCWHHHNYQRAELRTAPFFKYHRQNFHKCFFKNRYRKKNTFTFARKKSWKLPTSFEAFLQMVFLAIQTKMTYGNDEKRSQFADLPQDYTLENRQMHHSNFKKASISKIKFTLHFIFEKIIDLCGVQQKKIS